MKLRWIAVTLAVMVAGFWLVRSVQIDLVIAVGAAVVLLAVGHRSGLTWAEIGVSHSTWRRGLLWAAGSVVVVAAVYSVVLLTPLDVLLDDSRYDDGWAEAWLTALVVIPLGTVLWEEVAFRGVLWAQLRHYWSTQVATIASSLLFGVWHAIPALQFAHSNPGAGSFADGQTATIGTVVVTIVVTAAGGVVLCELRRRSGSLIAPIGLHWAINGLGVIAVALASSS
jgi:membrane protease YdiL (CAAX protease family)